MRPHAVSLAATRHEYPTRHNVITSFENSTGYTSESNFVTKPPAGREIPKRLKNSARCPAIEQSQGRKCVLIERNHEFTATLLFVQPEKRMYADRNDKRAIVRVAAQPRVCDRERSRSSDNVCGCSATYSIFPMRKSREDCRLSPATYNQAAAHGTIRMMCAQGFPRDPVQVPAERKMSVTQVTHLPPSRLATRLKYPVMWRHAVRATIK